MREVYHRKPNTASKLGALDPRDHSPEEFSIKPYTHGTTRTIKDLWCFFRNPFHSRQLMARFPELANLGFDMLLRDGKGISFRRLQAIVSSVLGGLQGKKILVVGCGYGEDLMTWLPCSPKEVYGIDLVNYERCWNQIEHYGRELGIHVGFEQADLTQFQEGKDNHKDYDLITCQAVLEHVTNIDALLKGVWKALKPGGVFLAVFGPLWFGPDGDHMHASNLDDLYNHLILSSDEYRTYVDRLMSENRYRENACAGPFLLSRGLFSYLKVDEYLDAFVRSGLSKIYAQATLAVEISDRFRLKFPKLWGKLVTQHNLKAFDPYVTGVTFIGRKLEKQST